MAKKRNRPSPKPNPRPGPNNSGNVFHRTKNPQNAEEAKKAIANDFRTTLLSYVQNDLLPETALARQNIRLVLGTSGDDVIKKFVKSQQENYQDRTPVTEPDIENKSEHGKPLKPKAKQVTKLQEYPKQIDLEKK
ncbi:MAG: hypothetical protein F6K35_32840 [Okeania sp. SIO2H7]|nr:hypothetical protein [Okeania sp. SIO2H7]